MKYEATKVDCSGSAKEEGSIILRGKTYSSTQNKCESYVYEAGSIELSNVLEPAPSIPVVDPIFANNNVADISAIANYISANALTSDDVYNEFGWSLGDSIPITLSTREVIEMQIIGFNHDDKSDGSGKAGITLQMKNCLSTLYPMNNSGTNAGGYAASKMKTETLPMLKGLLPQEWQDVIKLVDKKSANGGDINYSETLTLSEDLFLLSQIELYNTASGAQDGVNEGTVYEYWNGKDNSERIKKYDTNSDAVMDTVVYWWTRSCNIQNYAFQCVYPSGNCTYYVAYGNIGVSFAFCI